MRSSVLFTYLCECVRKKHGSGAQQNLFCHRQGPTVYTVHVQDIGYLPHLFCMQGLKRSLSYSKCVVDVQDVFITWHTKNGFKHADILICMCYDSPEIPYASDWESADQMLRSRNLSCFTCREYYTIKFSKSSKHMFKTCRKLWSTCATRLRIWICRNSKMLLCYPFLTRISVPQQQHKILQQQYLQTILWIWMFMTCSSPECRISWSKSFVSHAGSHCNTCSFRSFWVLHWTSVEPHATDSDSHTQHHCIYMCRTTQMQQSMALHVCILVFYLITHINNLSIILCHFFQHGVVGVIECHK